MGGATFQLEVVSAEAQLFSGRVTKIRITGCDGEMGIYPGHAPLLTIIRPGMVYSVDPNGEQKVIYLSGGLLEVQPTVVTVLADTAIRGEDLDKDRALHAKKVAEEGLRRFHGDIRYKKASLELKKALAKLKVIELVRKLNF